MDHVDATQIVLFFGGQIIVAAAIWGGIRADLKAMHERLNNVQKSADDAHARLDRHLESLHSRYTNGGK